MKILEQPVSLEELAGIAAVVFGDMVKAVLDVRRHDRFT